MPVDGRPPPEHAVIHPEVGSEVGSWGGPVGGSRGIPENTKRAGGIPSGEAPRADFVVI